jgi:hypothetical protein
LAWEQVEGHVVGENREARHCCGGIAQPVVVLVGHNDAIPALVIRGEVRSYPSHVTRNLSDDAVRGVATLQFDNDQGVR